MGGPAAEFERRFSLTSTPGDPYNSGICEGLSPRFEASMLGIHNVNSHSEHDLFIRLFLTGGGGW
jgi:hypothetical protein